MGYLQIYIRKGYKLSLKDSNLKIQKSEDENDINIIPIEDISGILLEDPNTLITTRLLTSLSSNGVFVVICDSSYVPNTLIVPYNTHYSMLGVYHKQISFLQQYKDKLWQIIIRKKIENQRRVVTMTSNDEIVIDDLSNLEKSVKLGDKDNREGLASRIYFTSLFGEDFTRFGGGPISAALNYGYTILNSAIVRYLTVYGFTSFLGIWHDSEKNNFNLASDIIESFRPLIDYFCYHKESELEIPLTSANRKKLISLMNCKVEIEDKVCTVDYAIDVVVRSLLKVLETKDCSNILLPTIIGVEFNE